MAFLDVAFYIYVGVVCIQVVLNLYLFGKFAFHKPTFPQKNTFGVSVVICAKNEAENLKTFLPFILTQDYPCFELVLINDASTDKTLKVMQAFADKHDHVTLVNVKNIEAFWGNKKYALTLGIKVAKHEHLLFTDADCRPVSKDWISSMTSHFNGTNTLVLGYGPYKKRTHSLLNLLIRFETLQTAVHYFSFALAGYPYMGVGRNLAYTKSGFFQANGFMGHMKVRSGDDDLFVNQVANKTNTAICYSKDSFTESLPETTFRNWINQKHRHISTAKYYRPKHKLLLSLIYSSQLLFWVLASILLIHWHQWKIVLGLLMVRWCVQFIIMGRSSKKLGEKDLVWLLPILEVFLVSLQLTIFIKNLISKPNHWK